MTTKTRSTVLRVLRVRIRTLLVVIAFLGLIFAIVLQTLRLNRMEARLSAELAFERARAAANFQRAKTAVDQYLTNVAQQIEADGSQSSDTRRESLKRTLKFYESAESNASTPEERASASERVRQVRLQLDGQPQ